MNQERYQGHVQTYIHNTLKINDALTRDVNMAAVVTIVAEIKYSETLAIDVLSAVRNGLQKYCATVYLWSDTKM